MVHSSFFLTRHSSIILFVIGLGWVPAGGGRRYMNSTLGFVTVCVVVGASQNWSYLQWICSIVLATKYYSLLRSSFMLVFLSGFATHLSHMFSFCDFSIIFSVGFATKFVCYRPILRQLWRRWARERRHIRWSWLVRQRLMQGSGIAGSAAALSSLFVGYFCGRLVVAIFCHWSRRWWPQQHVGGAGGGDETKWTGEPRRR